MCTTKWVSGDRLYNCISVKTIAQVQWMQNNSKLGLRHSKRGREDGKGKGEQDGKKSFWACVVQLKTCFSLLIWMQSVAFWYTDFYTTLYFVNQRNYKTLAMQAHALTHTHYFCTLNIIISHPIVYKEGLGYLSMCVIAPGSYSPHYVCICNSQQSLELFCIHCRCVLCRRTCVHCTGRPTCCTISITIQ
jgi:hypothetical protein